jgi:hypothetical protein
MQRDVLSENTTLRCGLNTQQSISPSTLKDRFLHPRLSLSPSLSLSLCVCASLAYTSQSAFCFPQYSKPGNGACDMIRFNTIRYDTIPKTQGDKTSKATQKLCMTRKRKTSFTVSLLPITSPFFLLATFRGFGFPESLLLLHKKEEERS